MTNAQIAALVAVMAVVTFLTSTWAGCCPRR